MDPAILHGNVAGDPSSQPDHLSNEGVFAFISHHFEKLNVFLI